MAGTCSALARSTGTGCQKSALTGSRYCIFHLDKGPLLFGAVVGAILSLMVSEGYRAIVPSKESRQLVGARNEAADLKKAVAAIEEEQKASAGREQRHLAQVAELNAKLDPFVKAALTRYPGLNVKDALERLRRELEEVRALASPPVLWYGGYKVQPGPEGPILEVGFSRSKDAPLGRLAFRVAVLPGSSGRIRNVEPLGLTMSVHTSVSGDGATAILEYSLPGGDDPGIKVALSGPTRIRVEGNNGLRPIVLDVR